MDADQFDALATRLTMLLTRRRSLATLGVIGLGAVALVDEASARKHKKKRKKRKKPTTTSTTPAPTCSDGVKNGSETGVDCGGTCPRCANGQTCLSIRDCASARCTGGTCTACATNADCRAGGAECGCFGDDGVCSNAGATRLAPGGCTDCPANTAFCLPTPFGVSGVCYPRCGEVFPS